MHRTDSLAESSTAIFKNTTVPDDSDTQMYSDDMVYGHLSSEVLQHRNGQPLMPKRDVLTDEQN